MFGKKNKTPEDPRVEVIRGLIPKKHRGFDTNLSEVVKYIPASSTIVAAIPANGLSSDYWVLTDKSVHLWSLFNQMVVPLDSRIVAGKGIGYVEIGTPSSDAVKISAHPKNVEAFYQVLMANI